MSDNYFLLPNYKCFSLSPFCRSIGTPWEKWDHQPPHSTVVVDTLEAMSDERNERQPRPVSNVSLPFVVFGVDGYDTVPVAKGGLDYFILSCSRLDLLGEFMYSDDALPLRQTNGCSSLQWMLNISTTSRRLL
eukprot:scaffold8222_cov125-Alexandrium_tamarense.AAC.1